MQEKIHFSYKFLIRLTRFSYKILYISTRFSDFESKSSLRCPCSIPEDVPIDFRVIACRIKIAPYGGVINAALQPLREVLEIATFLAQVLGEIFCALVLALVALLEIFERALIPITEVCLVSLAAFPRSARHKL